MTFWNRECWYCGYVNKTVGIDRVDSSKGYTLENAVAACKCCNQGKSDLTQEQWFELCRNVVLRHRLI
jgi:5-methylcytosine-specific restriction endonuclease McrA